MCYQIKRILGYTSIIALLNSSMVPLYAVHDKHLQEDSVNEEGSKQRHILQKKSKTKEKFSRPLGLVFEDYLSEKIKTWTPDFVKEGYDDFCDWLENSWFARTVKEVAPIVCAKSPMEIDYHDPGYWQAHFMEQVENLKGLKPAAAQKTLIDLQDLVWHGLLSPFIYEQEMETLGSSKPTRKQMRKDFRNVLKSDRTFLKSSFARDILGFLQGFREQKEEIKDNIKGLNALLNYYRQVQNSLDYEESLDDLWHSVLRNRQDLSLTQETYEPLNDALFKTMINARASRNQTEYEALKAEHKSQMQKAWETRLAFEELPEYDEDSAFNSALPIKEKEKPVSFAEGAKKGLKKFARTVKEGLRYASENPGKTIATGLFAQVTAAAAWNTFKVNTFKASEKKTHPYDELTEKQSQSEKELPRKNTGEKSPLSVFSLGMLNAQLEMSFKLAKIQHLILISLLLQHYQMEIVL